MAMYPRDVDERNFASDEDEAPCHVLRRWPARTLRTHRAAVTPADGYGSGYGDKRRSNPRSRIC
jgi:hypothetical protein